MNQSPLRTREEVLAEFTRKGISLRSWALANGVSPQAVRGVLKGGRKGSIGEGHKAAVKLGLKHGEIVE
ncbi:MAG: DNA-binding protein [Hydrogenophaga sp.]|nr:DNA-binding protein [Hydrogenophaga sp.]